MLKNVRTLTSRGRVTIPKEIRDELGLRPQDMVRFTVVDGEVQFEKAHVSQGEVAGSLKGHSYAGTVKEAIKQIQNEQAQ